MATNRTPYQGRHARPSLLHGGRHRIQPRQRESIGKSILRTSAGLALAGVALGATNGLLSPKQNIPESQEVGRAPQETCSILDPESVEDTHTRWKAKGEDAPLTRVIVGLKLESNSYTAQFFRGGSSVDVVAAEIAPNDASGTPIRGAFEFSSVGDPRVNLYAPTDAPAGSLIHFSLISPEKDWRTPCIDQLVYQDLVYQDGEWRYGGHAPSQATAPVN